MAKKNKIDRRTRLLARMAGNIAAGLVTAPSKASRSAEAIAAISVDIAEEILNKVGILEEPEAYPGAEHSAS